MKYKDYIRNIHINWMRWHAFHLPELKFQTSKVIIIAPHPDDETLGLGGMIQRLSQLGFPPYVIILSKGERSHQDCCNLSLENIKNKRIALATTALEHLSLPEDHLFFLDFPDSAIDATDKEMISLQRLINRLSPEMIFIPHRQEGWPDHVKTAEAITKIIRDKVDIYEYIVWAWYYNVWRFNWRNAMILRMSPEEHKTKSEAIDIYTQALAPCGKPWSGVLPKLLIKACTWNCELFFRIQKH